MPSIFSTQRSLTTALKEKAGLYVLTALMLAVATGGIVRFSAFLNQTRTETTADYQTRLEQLAGLAETALLQAGPTEAVQALHSPAELIFGHMPARITLLDHHFRPGPEITTGEAPPTPFISGASLDELRRRLQSGNSFFMQKTLLEEGIPRRLLIFAIPFNHADGPCTGLLATVRHRDFYGFFISALIMFSATFVLLLAFVLAFMALLLNRRLSDQAEILRLSQVVEQSPAMIVLADLKGRIEYVNPRFTRVTEYEEGELTGQPLRVLLDPDEENPEKTARIWKQLKNGENWSGEIHCRKKSGLWFWQNVSIFPVHDRRGRITCYAAQQEDITDRKLLEAALQQQLAFSQTIHQTIPSPIFFKNTDGKYEGCNLAFEEYTGRAQNELIGLTEAQVFPHDDLDQMSAVDRRIAAGENSCTIECVLTDARKRRHNLLVSKAGYSDAAGRIQGIVGVMIDITRQKQLQREMEVTVEQARSLAVEARAASVAKSEFLANMSHEIRTPMNAIIGMTELALESGLNEEQRDCIEIVHHSAVHLLRLVSSILDFSKIEAQRLELEQKPFLLRPMLEMCCSSFQAQAREKNIRLELELDPQVPEAILGDDHRIAQILINLIGNAVKFTAAGSVILRVQPTAASEKDAGWITLEFEVADTGIGMSPDEFKNIFIPFVQADASTTRNFGGTGLGLSISRKLAGLMGGTLTAESVKGEGSVFRFSAPFKECEPPEETLRPSPVVKTKKMPTGTGSRILVAEDNLVNARLAERLVQKRGDRCLPVRTGREAVQAWEKEKPDLILMDCQMPEMDGYEAARTIRRREAANRTTEPVPIIAMTANAMSGDRERCLRAGMTDYLSKPVRQAELLAMLDRYLAPAADQPESKSG